MKRGCTYEEVAIENCALVELYKFVYDRTSAAINELLPGVEGNLGFLDIHESLARRKSACVVCFNEQNAAVGRRGSGLPVKTAKGRIPVHARGKT